jgi:transposase
VEAILATIERIGLDRLISAKRTPERDRVVAMIAERLIHPCSKLATTRLWHCTTLAESLAVSEADEEDLYGAMDWLLKRQALIEKKLAARHFETASQVLYDVSSSYYEGRRCPLVFFGHSRDGKKGKPILVYGVLTDRQGRPIAVEVYPGNTADPTTVSDQVDKLKRRFGLEQAVLVGDRGMLTHTRIEALKAHPGIGWISALRAERVRQLVEQQHLQLSLFDQQNLAEIASPDFPGERLIACFNPLLAEERRRKREDLLAATESALERIQKEVARRTKTPLSAAEIGKKLGRVVNRFKVGKHFDTTIGDGHFRYMRRHEAIELEAQLDGIYVIRTSESAQRLCAEDTARSYKNLAQVERAFRTLKGVELRIRPIHHRSEERVRAHVFLCLLAYYVEWHMRQAWKPLLFDDEKLAVERAQRDPVAPAAPSATAERKKRVRMTAEGWPVHSFTTLMAELATRCRNRCRLKADPQSPVIYQHTDPTPLQARALEMIRLLPVPGN